MYTEQVSRNLPAVDLSYVAAGVCLVCGVVEVGLFATGAPSASMLTVGLGEVGALAALAYRLTLRTSDRRVTRKKTRGAIDAMSKGERALLARLRNKPIAVFKDGDQWRPSGSLPRASSPADFNGLIRDNFVFIDVKRRIAHLGD